MRLFATALKKKHSKTGEESRYQGTALGIPAEEKAVIIEGGPLESLQDWNTRLKDQPKLEQKSTIQQQDSTQTSSESSPLSDI